MPAWFELWPRSAAGRQGPRADARPNRIGPRHRRRLVVNVLLTEVQKTCVWISINCDGAPPAMTRSRIPCPILPFTRRKGTPGQWQALSSYRPCPFACIGVPPKSPGMGKSDSVRAGGVVMSEHSRRQAEPCGSVRLVGPTNSGSGFRLS